MRLICKLLLGVVGLVPLSLSGAVVQTDPLLTAAIIEQTVEINRLANERSKHHKAIEAAQTGITVALDRIHSVEDKMLEYLSNASGVVQNMYQIKRIAELAAVEIPDNLVNLGKSVPSNIKGTAITLFVNKTITETSTDIVALSDIVNRLVTSHYSYKNNKNKDDNNINLLSAAERYAILQSVYQRLNQINWRLRLTSYYIKTFGWRELWMGLDRESYCKIMYARMSTKHLINRWNQL